MGAGRGDGLGEVVGHFHVVLLEALGVKTTQAKTQVVRWVSHRAIVSCLSGFSVGRREGVAENEAEELVRNRFSRQ